MIGAAPARICAASFSAAARSGATSSGIRNTADADRTKVNAPGIRDRISPLKAESSRSARPGAASAASVSSSSGSSTTTHARFGSRCPRRSACRAMRSASSPSSPPASTSSTRSPRNRRSTSAAARSLDSSTASTVDPCSRARTRPCVSVGGSSSPTASTPRTSDPVRTGTTSIGRAGRPADIRTSRAPACPREAGRWIRAGIPSDVSPSPRARAPSIE